MAGNCCRFGLLLSLAAAWALAPASVQAQAVDPAPLARHAIYGEVLGNGFLYSVNYEHAWTPLLRGRVGFEMLRRSSALVPAMVAIVTGKGRHHLELGGGALIGIGLFDGEELRNRHLAAGALAVAVAGYRYQRPEGGFIFRAGVTPFIWLDGGPVLWFGVSVGRSF